MAANTALQPLVGYLRELAVGNELTDRQLLEAFTRQGSEDAFRRLVHRHGPLVLGVCRRALPTEQDAEDCFQATFLLLARKAGDGRWQESVAGWLHEVARRLAAEARVREARRQRRERQAAARTAPDDGRLAELAAAVDEELARLPEHCRVPLLLCYLQGQPHTKAAGRLGLSLRTLERRLQAGRALLRDRLVRRGVTLSAGLLAWQLTQAAVALPTSLAASACQAGLAFAHGAALATVPHGAAELVRPVLRGWLWARVRGAVAVVLATGLLALGGSAWWSNEPASAGALVGAKATPAAPVVLQEAGTAAAIDEGRRWLVRQQLPDGGWKLDAATPNDTAATAFGLLPLLAAADETAPADKRIGPYTAAVERGLKALLPMQDKDGGFRGGMYAHGLATAALCEGYRLTRNAALKPPAQRALDYTVKAQHAGGGWRYAPGQPGDTSVTAWQVLALDRGVAAGLDVPKATLQRVSVYLDSVASDDGAAYGYIQAGTGSFSMIAAGLNCRFLLGWQPRHEAALRGAAQLKKMPPQAGLASAYYYHFATRVLHRIGGADWDFWEPRLVQVLLERQEQAGAQRGSWPTTGDPFAGAGGRLMVTSLTLKTLEPCGRLTAPPPPRPAEQFRERQAAADWEGLLSRDLAVVRPAIDRLASAPTQAVPLLRDRLRPAAPPDAERVGRLVRELDSDDFTVRTAASEALQALGEPVAPALRRAVATARSLEMRRRLELLIDQVDPPQRPRRLRQLRAVQVLELAGTPEARAVLEALVREQPNTPLATAARAALDRLDRRAAR